MLIRNRKSNQKGMALLIVVIFFVLISLIILFSVAGPAVSENSIANNNLKSRQAYFFNEGALEDVIYRIMNVKQVSPTETLVGQNANSTITTTTTSNQKQVYAVGDAAGVNRSVLATVKAGTGIAFNYGIQTGQGGLILANNAGINGNVYSNGPVVGSAGAFITGTIISADGYSAVADQSHGVGGTVTENTNFGNASSTADMAQSFILSANNNLAKVSLHIRKVGSPGSPTVTIRTNNSGNPSSTIVATGTLSSSLVSPTYGWVDVTFSTAPQLSAGTTYWLTIDMSSTSGSNYYQIGGAVSGYANGLLKIGSVGGTWYTSSPQVTSNTDAFFEVYTGGATGSISDVIVGSGGVGDAWANSVTGSTVAGALYCKTGSSNNKSCNTVRDNPVPQPMSVSDSNIADWKAVALAGGTTTGNVTISSNQSLGPRKIVGNLTVGNSKTLTLDGVLWVTGNIDVSNNGLIKLASSYGANSGMIIADGNINISNNGDMRGSGTTGSYIMALSTSTSGSAITLDNNSGSVILVAPYGTVSLSNNATAKEVTGYSINLSNNAVVTYDTGLPSASFSTGPGGAWIVDSWDETE